MEKKKIPIAYNGKIYEVKAIFRIHEPRIETSQVALLIQEKGKDYNEIMIIDAFEFYDAIERRLGEYIEVKNVSIISIEDWIKSLKMKEKKE